MVSSDALEQRSARSHGKIELTDTNRLARDAARTARRDVDALKYDDLLLGYPLAN